MNIPPPSGPAGHDATTDDPAPVRGVKHGRLPRRNPHHWLVETSRPRPVARLLDGTRDRPAVVPDLDARGIPGIEEEVQVPDRNLTYLQFPLAAHHDLAGGGPHLGDVQRRRRRNPDAASLADGEVHDAAVAAEHPSLPVDHLPGFRRHLLAHEAAVVSVGDKADVLALRRVGHGEAALLPD